jgi:hypothetical protein
MPSKVTIRVQGAAEIEAALKELGAAAANRIARSALTRSATPIVKRAKELVPVGYGCAPVHWLFWHNSSAPEKPTGASPQTPRGKVVKDQGITLSLRESVLATRKPMMLPPLTEAIQ